MVVHKRKINEREPYILVQCSCAVKINNSVGTLNFGRMVVHIASAKIMEREGSISPYSFYQKMLDCSEQSHGTISLFSKFFCYITRFVT